MIRSIAIAIALLALLPTLASAGEDIAGAKDHPLLTRYPQSFITAYKQGPDFVTFKVKTEDGKTETTPVKGKTTVITYAFEKKIALAGSAPVMTHFRDKASNPRPDELYYRSGSYLAGDPGEATYKLMVDGKAVWIKVEPQDTFGSDKTGYVLTVVEASDEQPFGPKRRKGMP